MESTLTESKTKAGYVLTLLKSCLLGIIVSLILILIFALILKIVALDGGSIAYVNQGIKVISILFACLKMSKHLESKYFLHGMLVGAVYTILSFVIFSTLNGKFELQMSLITDLGFSMLIGAICAIISKAIVKKR